jgi:hypothetical protein
VPAWLYLPIPDTLLWLKPCRGVEDIGSLSGKRPTALVGKCNMDINAPGYLRDAIVASSLEETVECLQHLRKIDPTEQLVRAVPTPLFAIFCTPELLSSLGRSPPMNLKSQ